MENKHSVLIPWNDHDSSATDRSAPHRDRVSMPNFFGDGRRCSGHRHPVPTQAAPESPPTIARPSRYVSPFPLPATRAHRAHDHALSLRQAQRVDQCGLILEARCYGKSFRTTGRRPSQCGLRLNRYFLNLDPNKCGNFASADASLPPTWAIHGRDSALVTMFVLGFGTRQKRE
jgi:hypothetical protein